MKSQTRCLFVALLAVCIVLLWQSLTVHYNYEGNWTGLFCTGENRPVPPQLEQKTYRFRQQNGYDGQFYRYLAYDPFLTQGMSSYIDIPDLRGRRILVPGLAFLLALGRPASIDAAYIGVIAFWIGAGVYWTASLLAKNGIHPAAGLGFLALPGALVSVDRMLLDGVLAALFVGLLLSVEENDTVSTYMICLLAALTRETGLLFVAGIVAAAFLKRDWRRAVVFSTAAVPAVLWFFYVGPAVPMPFRDTVLAFLPGFGFARRLFEQRSGMLLQVTDMVALAGVIASLAYACFYIRKKLPGAIQISIAFFILMGLTLGAREHLTEPYGFARPIAPLLAYVFISGLRSGMSGAVISPLLVSVGIGVSFLWQIAGIARSIV